MRRMIRGTAAPAAALLSALGARRSARETGGGTNAPPDGIRMTW